VAREARWFDAAGGPVPAAAPFAALLESYGSARGLERAIVRTAGRLRRPQGLLHAARDWEQRVPQLTAGLPQLLDDLRQAARQFS